MNGSSNRIRGYLLASFLGALLGGVFVAIVSRTLPKIMQGMVSEMMENMCGGMAELMGEQGITPMEMCQKMLAGRNVPDSNAVEAEP